MSEENNNLLPKSWLEVPIAEVADVSLGKTPKKSHYTNEGKIRLIKFRDVTDDGLDLSETKDAFVRDEPAAIKGLQPVKKGDILLTASAHNPEYIGRKTAIVDELPEGFDYFYVGELLSIRPHDGIDPRWIAAYLRSEQGYKHIQAHVHGMHLTNGRAQNILIRIAPPTYMQMAVQAMEALRERRQRVREALSEVGSLLEQCRQSVLAAAFRGDLTADWRAAHPHVEPASALLQRIRAERRHRWEQAELAKYASKGQKSPKNWQEKYQEPEPADDSALLELPAGWVWATVDELSMFLTSGSRGWAKYYSNTGPLFIRAQNINTDRLIMDDIAHVTPPSGSEGERTRVMRNDLLITITGANVTKAAYINLDIDEAYVSQHVALVRLVEPTLAKYVYFWTISPANGRSQLLADAYGNGKPGLNLDNIRTMAVALPPITEQVVLLARVEEMLLKTDLVRQDAKAIENDLDQLDQSILAKAFRGELVPQDPNDEPASILLERIRVQRVQQAKEAKSTKRTAKTQGGDKMKKKASGLTLQRRPLTEVLIDKGQAMAPEQLLAEAGYDDASIEEFYLALREEIAQGRIREDRPSEKDVMLEAVKP